MPVTIKDIAKAADVSHTTVSRALRNNPAISLETTCRIQDLAREMGYTPSAVAQSLLSRQTWTIGMVITTIADPFVVQVVEGVEKVAQAANYSIFLATSHNNPNQELAVVETLHRRRVDAIIVTSSRVGSLYSSQLDKIEVPIVLINNQEEGDYLHSVVANDVQGGRLAVEHLLNLGHRRIGFVGVRDRPQSNRNRLAGYRAGLEAADLPFDPALVVRSQNGTDIEPGQHALDTLLSAQATAIFCYNDVAAIGLMMACRRQGIVVPDQLSIVGFDDIEAALYLTPALTTINQPRLCLGQRAMEMTLKLLKGQNVQDQILSCSLVVRGTTSRPHNDFF